MESGEGQYKKIPGKIFFLMRRFLEKKRNLRTLVAACSFERQKEEAVGAVSSLILQKHLDIDLKPLPGFLCAIDASEEKLAGVHETGENQII